MEQQQSSFSLLPGYRTLWKPWTRRSFPLAIRSGSNGEAWVTLRDASALVRLSAAGEEMARWRLPPWPHTTHVDRFGVVWTGLTRSGAIAGVDPITTDVTLVSLRPSAEILGLTCGRETIHVVDAGNRQLWSVDATTHLAVPRDIPGAIRPDIPVVATDGSVWITDTERAVIMVWHPPNGEWDELPVVDGTRLIVREPTGELVWCTTTRRPSLIAIDVATRKTQEIPLPGVGFGLDASSEGLIACCIPDQEAVVVLRSGEIVARVDLPPGSRPHDASWTGDDLLVTCPGISAVTRITIT